MKSLKIRALSCAAAGALALAAAGSAQAAYLVFNERTASSLTFFGGDFEGGIFFTPDGPTVSKGTTIDLTAEWNTLSAPYSSGVFLITSATNPAHIVAEMDYTVSPNGGGYSSLTATYWGEGSGHVWSSSGTRLASNANGLAVGGLPFLSIFFAGTGAVPEPASWAMMVLGFGFVGAGIRQRKRVTVRYS